jgi:type II secretory pathway component PulK
MLTTNSPLEGVSLNNVRLGRGSFSVKIVDNESKMNINKLQDPQRTLDTAMRLIGVDAGDAGPITASILDWMSPDKNSLIGGTESRYYESLDPPYQAKDGPIDDLSELLLVRGIREMPEIYWGGLARDRLPSMFQNRIGIQMPGEGTATSGIGLVDLFTPLSSGQININTASNYVLQLIPIIDENIAQRIIQLREGEGIEGAEATPFRDARDALLRAGANPQLIPQFQGYFTVQSRVFEVQVDAEINGYHRYFYATLLRNSPRDVQVLMFHWKFSPPATSPTASHASAR